MEQTKEQLYKVEDCGLLIGLINVPIGTNLSDFFKNEMQETIFQQYRNNIFEEDNTDSTINYLYKPHAYHLLGEHNLAVLSLVDDFAFSQRVFHSSHCFPKKDMKIENYMIRTITGVSTYPANEKPRLADTARQTFLAADSNISDTPLEPIPYPFIGIVRYKLNNGLLIGNGQDYLEAVKSVITQKQEKEIKIFIVDSFCNNELTLVIFADTPQKIVNFVTDSRQFTTSDLSNYRDNIYNHALQGKVTGTSVEEFNHLHLFSSSHTLLGFDLDLFSQTDKKKKYNDEKFPIKLYWDIKPGHIYNVYKDLEEVAPYIKNKKIIIGESSLVYEHEFTLLEYISFVNAWENRLSNSGNPRGESNRNDLRHLRISLEMGINDTILIKRKAEHPLNRLFDKMKIEKKDIDDFHNSLLSLGVPKVLEQRLQKVFSNFNDCIADPLFAICFMEIRNYLLCLNKIIKDAKTQGNLEELQEILNGFIANFEQAYYNRFHHSNRIIGLDDFNLEYNGGIQQLLSGFDAVYKYIASFLHELPSNAQTEANISKLPPFAHVVCVSGYERVCSDRGRMMINILYMTYPELFAATVWKEALNSFFSNEVIKHLDQLITGDQYDFLFQGLKEKEFPNHISNEIQQDNRFKESIYSHHLLCETLNITFLKYILVDGLVLKCGYEQDFEQFYYWYWKVFLQMNHLMEKTSEKTSICYNTDNFIIMLFRLVYWAYHLDKQDETSPKKTRINKIRWTPFDPALKDLWTLHFNDVYTYVQVVYSQLEKMAFNPFIDLIVDNVNLKLLPPLDPISKGETNSEKKKSNSKNVDAELHKLYEIRRNTYQSMLTTPLQYFQQNEIITYEEGNKTLYISLILKAYLHQIKELNTNINGLGVRQALERDPKGKPILDGHTYAPLLSDSYGGIFIVKDPDIRKKYYALRSVFYKSIWDFSMKSKTEIFPLSVK